MNLTAFSPNIPQRPLARIAKAFFIGVNGVLNSCETIEINSDFTRSSFSNSWFFSIISLYKPALFKGRETC